MFHRHKNRFVKKCERTRVQRAITLVSRARGTQNESFAQKACEELTKKGKLLRFWAIPSQGRLDREGIDIIVETITGFYFLNVKSSRTGVDSFNARQLSKVRWRIYPWLVQQIYGSAEAMKRLENILACNEPSCIVLPESVLRGLKEPPKKPTRENQAPKITAAKPTNIVRERNIQKQKPEIKKETAVMRGYITIAEYLKLARIKPSEKLRTLERTGNCAVKDWEILQLGNDRFSVRITIDIFGKQVSENDEDREIERTVELTAGAVVQHIFMLPECKTSFLKIEGLC